MEVLTRAFGVAIEHATVTAENTRRRVKPTPDTCGPTLVRRVVFGVASGPGPSPSGPTAPSQPPDCQAKTASQTANTDLAFTRSEFQSSSPKGEVLLQMRTPDQYREFAAEYYRLAEEAQTQEQQKLLREMARAWREVAEEVETKT